MSIEKLCENSLKYQGFSPKLLFGPLHWNPLFIWNRISIFNIFIMLSQGGTVFPIFYLPIIIGQIINFFR